MHIYIYIYIYIHTYIYIYVYKFVCVCVCDCVCINRYYGNFQSEQRDASIPIKTDPYQTFGHSLPFLLVPFDAESPTLPPESTNTLC